MPVLSSETERFALSAGTYTIGGHGPNAVPISSLGRCPAVAALVVPPDGPATIQRLAAGVVVRLDRVPLGVAPKELHDTAEIEFDKSRLTFTTDADSHTAITPSASDAVTVERSVIFPARAATELHRRYEATDVHPAAEPAGVKARIVNVRTGDAVALADQRIVVGRDDACDLVLLGMGVSRRHFSVTPVRGGYLLRDESANGTLVNGKPVSGGYLLGHGDVLRLDKEELRFELEGVEAPARTAEAMPTQILDLSRLRGEVETGTTRDRVSTPIEASLEVIGGPYAGASFVVERAVCSIGRSAQADVRLPDHSVSINHATLLRKGASWFVVDLRSANGTFVDGSRVAGEREVTSGSRLRLGSVELAFRALNSGIEPPIEQPRKRWGLLRLLRPFRRTPAGNA
jgi:pSer/pThr/pTyr-binding forkhead associated (FHA) protein